MSPGFGLAVKANPSPPAADFGPTETASGSSASSTGLSFGTFGSGNAPSHSGLTSGAIAGIVVGVLLGLLFIIGFVVLLLVFLRRHAQQAAGAGHRQQRFEGEGGEPAMAEAQKVGAGLGTGGGGLPEIDGRQVKLADRAPAYPGLGAAPAAVGVAGAPPPRRTCLSWTAARHSSSSFPSLTAGTRRPTLRPSAGGPLERHPHEQRSGTAGLRSARHRRRRHRRSPVPTPTAAASLLVPADAKLHDKRAALPHPEARLLRSRPLPRRAPRHRTSTRRS